MGQRIFITGCAGYLAQRLIEGCRSNPEIEWLGGVDVREPADTNNIHFFHADIRSPEIGALLQQQHVTTVVHLAWVFNPTHEPQLEYEVDVLGSRNILECVKKAGIPYVIYLSSTTAYGPQPDNPPVFDETYPRRGHDGYLYAKYKAEVDHLMLEFLAENPGIRVFVVRAPIILGPNTRNVVTTMTEMPVMVGIRGYDPQMQFLHEEDLKRLLLWAIAHQPVGVFNVPGHGTIRLREIARHLKKRIVWIPSWFLYPALNALWKMHLVPFPASILDFVRYPWVAGGEKFQAAYDFKIQHSSEEAFLAYARSRR